MLLKEPLHTMMIMNLLGILLTMVMAIAFTVMMIVFEHEEYLLEASQLTNVCSVQCTLADV